MYMCVCVQSAAADPNSVRLPPVNENDPNRCERAFTGNTIGQANAVSNEALDFRGCSYEVSGTYFFPVLLAWFGRLGFVW